MSRPDAAALVLCVACAARFPVQAAVPGARVRCPICATEVVVGRLCVEERRYRERSTPPREPKRISKRALRRLAVGFVVGAAIVILGGALVHWREPIVDFVGEAGGAIVRLAKPR